MQTSLVGEGMSRLDARAAFRQYRNALKQCRSPSAAEDELLMKTYREIARGCRVLDLRETLKLAGVDERWRPKLAIARADAAMVWFERQWAVGRWCFCDRRRFLKAMLGSGRAIVVPSGVFPQLEPVGSDEPSLDFENDRPAGARPTAAAETRVNRLPRYRRFLSEAEAVA